MIRTALAAIAFAGLLSAGCVHLPSAPNPPAVTLLESVPKDPEPPGPREADAEPRRERHASVRPPAQPPNPNIPRPGPR